MSIGPVQILLILVVVLIVFGAGKLPKVMGDIGSGIKSFKKGLNEDEKKQVSEKSEIDSKLEENSVIKNDSESKGKKSWGLLYKTVGKYVIWFSLCSVYHF